MSTKHQTQRPTSLQPSIGRSPRLSTPRRAYEPREPRAPRAPTDEGQASLRGLFHGHVILDVNGRAALPGDWVYDTDIVQLTPVALTNAPPVTGRLYVFFGDTAPSHSVATVISTAGATDAGVRVSWIGYKL